MSGRQDANRRILGRIEAMVESHPDWRFHQILQNLGVEVPNTDQWYEESEDTLSAVVAASDDRKEGSAR